MEANTIVAHIQGKCEVPGENVPDMIIHWALLSHFARFDRVNSPRFWWPIKYFCLPVRYQVMHNRSVRL